MKFWNNLRKNWNFRKQFYKAQYKKIKTEEITSAVNFQNFDRLIDPQNFNRSKK